MVACEHCKGDVAIRNPTGFCDHLYYPEYCKVCQARGIDFERAMHRIAGGKRYGNGEGLALSVETCQAELENFMLRYDSFPPNGREKDLIRDAFEAGWFAREEA